MNKKLIIIFLLASVHYCGKAQQLNHTMSRDFLWTAERSLNSKDNKSQTFIKPYRTEIVFADGKFCAVLDTSGRKTDSIPGKKKLDISAAPLLSAYAGAEFGTRSRTTYELGIGARVFANIGKKFSFEVRGWGQTGKYTSFLDSIIRESSVVPGVGYAYPAGNDSIAAGYATQQFSGYLSWSPNRIFNIQAGQDKHFWGDGYRSLFLSDVSAPYPFLKITTNVWRLSYVNLYTIMKDVTGPTGMKSDFRNKYATLHYLGWQATKRIQVGLFESVIWQGSDSTRNRGYDVNYLNPVIFFRPTEYSLGSSDNALLGFSFKIKMFKRQQLYGQILLDEFLLKEVREGKGWWANKQALQAGFKVFDLFRIKDLNFQTEINYVRPYTYAHASVQQNYGHYNQTLAHPLGANFTESANFINYRKNKFFIELKFVYAVYGGDSAGTDYGKNIFISYRNRPHDYYNYTGQGFYNRLMTASVRAAYLIPSFNTKVELGFADRIHENAYSVRHVPYVFLGIRTELSNLYDDF
jgi:hypothetical protein